MFREIKTMGDLMDWANRVNNPKAKAVLRSYFQGFCISHGIAPFSEKAIREWRKEPVSADALTDCMLTDCAEGGAANG